MSGDCRSIDVSTAQVVASNPNAESVYPMRSTVRRTTAGTCTMAWVVISPATTTMPVVTSVSQATREFGSSASMASSTASDT